METETDHSEIIFNQEGTFKALYAAQRWCGENGYSYGSLCSPQPVGMLKGDYNIAKWRNLTAKERKQLDGIITSDDFREGPVKITLYNNQKENGNRNS